MMTTADRVSEYLDAVARALPPAWPRREVALADLRQHIDAAVEQGASEAEAIARLGSAESVAASIAAGYEPESAPLAPRLGAFMVDLGIGWAALWVGLGTLMTLGWIEPLAWIALGWFIAAGLLAVVYFPAFEATVGRTPGKALLGLHVVREDGRAIGWKEAVLRRLPLFFEFFMLDALFAPFTKRRQRAFDLVAGTVVVRAPEERDQRVALAWLIGLLLWFAPLVYFSAVNGFR